MEDPPAGSDNSHEGLPARAGYRTTTPFQRSSMAPDRGHLVTPARNGGPARLQRPRSVARTDIGLVRSVNEDNLVDRPMAGLWAVADGMGGHSQGDRASGLIREMLEGVTPSANPEAYVAAVNASLKGAHAKLRADCGIGTCGSTVAALVVVGDRYACTWAGDSRIYRLRDGQLERLTRDHSLVQDLVSAGMLTPEAAFRHPLSNRITRAVGVSDDLEFDLVRGRIVPGDRYIISSDGLHGVIPDREIAELASIPDLGAAVDAMMAAVKQAGAPDNVTIVLVEFGASA